jgi:hypothetical protein
VFSVGSAPRLYNEDLRQLRGELRESLETAVEDDGEEKTKWFVKCSNKMYKCAINLVNKNPLIRQAPPPPKYMLVLTGCSKGHKSLTVSVIIDY